MNRNATLAIAFGVVAFLIALLMFGLPLGWYTVLAAVVGVVAGFFALVCLENAKGSQSAAE